MSDLQKKDEEYIAHTYARFPVSILSGKGSLVFDENGKGATYVAPRFIRGGQHTTSPTEGENAVEMKRKGYTFGGWYNTAACVDISPPSNGNSPDGLHLGR